MGVIKDLSSYFEAYTPSIEDSLEEVSSDETPPEELNRHRSRRPPKLLPPPVRPQHTAKNVPLKSKGGKKYRRFENTNYLMSLGEGEDLNEVSINDFLQGSLSAFAQVLMERDNIQMWNDFINCSDGDWCIPTTSKPKKKAQDLMELSQSGLSTYTQNNFEAPPEFTAEECFRKIDSELRSMLRKRHVPLGTLSQLECDLSSSFQACPGAVCLLQLANSFERLMVHALAQYMDLCSNSYNKEGIRWTRVHNRHSLFRPPAMMLATYLEQRALLRRSL